jgi:hypothetical protein
MENHSLGGTGVKATDSLRNLDDLIQISHEQLCVPLSVRTSIKEGDVQTDFTSI